MTKHNPLERQIHLGICQLLKLCAKPDVVFYHTANERRCSPREGAFLKTLGVLAGVPDFTIITFPARVSFLEIKRPGGKLTEAQEQFRDRVEALGCTYAVARSTDEAKRILSEMGVLRNSDPVSIKRAA